MLALFETLLRGNFRCGRMLFSRTADAARAQNRAC